MKKPHPFYTRQYLSMTLLLPTIIVSLVFSGCATKEPPPLDMTQLPKVAEVILEEAIYYSSLFSACSKLGDEAEIEALTKQQDWLAANWQLVSAADAAYTQHYSSSSFNYNSKPFLPQALWLKKKAHEKAINTLRLSTRTPVNQQKVCLFQLTKITPETISLISTNSQIAAYEQALLTNAPAHSNQIVDLPTLAARIATDLPSGKNHFSIKQQNESQCENASTLIFANNWPDEAYANFCGDELKQVLICEWDTCNPR